MLSPEEDPSSSTYNGRNGKILEKPAALASWLKARMNRVLSQVLEGCGVSFALLTRGNYITAGSPAELSCSQQQPQLPTLIQLNSLKILVS